jgi:hypothetical protein
VGHDVQHRDHRTSVDLDIATDRKPFGPQRLLLGVGHGGDDCNDRWIVRINFEAGNTGHVGFDRQGQVDDPAEFELAWRLRQGSRSEEDEREKWQSKRCALIIIVALLI